MYIYIIYIYIERERERERERDIYREIWNGLLSGKTQYLRISFARRSLQGRKIYSRVIYDIG